MDSEVTEKALEQFLAFKEMTGQLVIEYKIVVDKELSENSVSQNAFYQVCNSIFGGLKQEINKALERLSSGKFEKWTSVGACSVGI